MFRHVNRRSFVKSMMAAASAPTMSRLATLNAFASPTATSSKYKAAVCIKLDGGNDGNNMIIPVDNAGYKQYASIRGSLALSEGSLLPLSLSGGAGLAVHPNLPNIQGLFNSGLASVVANVGPMLSPLTKTQISAGADVPLLFSHPSCIAEWESGAQNAGATLGWGGQIADLLGSAAGVAPGVVSMGGNSLFLVGSSTTGVSLSMATTYLPSVPQDTLPISVQLANEELNSPVSMVRLAAAEKLRALSTQTTFAAAIADGASITTTFPATGLGSNLQTVAKIIAGHSTLEASRQIFFCEQQGYDTHVSQLGTQAWLLSTLDQAVGAFMSAMAEIGLANDVLVFTISDFGRTYQANTSAGADHGWGNYHFVIGGSNGGRVLGKLPSGELGGSDDMTGEGAWIPTTSSAQMAAGIANWLGIPAAQTSSIFPDLQNFPLGALSF